jgi:hypothetical protein
MSETSTQCPLCSSPVTHEQFTGGPERYQPAPLSPAILTVALDNEAVSRAVAGLATAELRLAIAAVMLEGGARPDPFFTEQDVRDEAEAAARCDGVAEQLRKQGTRFAEAADFRDAADRHRKRAKRILLLMPEATQRKIHAQIVGEPKPKIEVVPK